MTDDDRPPTLQQLDAKLREVRGREPQGGGGERDQGSATARDQSGMGIAMRVGTELVAGVAVGTGVGWALDRWLGTGPWLLVVFFLLGSAAGMLTVFRGLQRMGRPGGSGRP